MPHGSVKRSLGIVLACAVLLAAFGGTYYVYRRRMAATQGAPLARGTVIQAAGNTVTLRDFGKDGTVSDDDRLITYVLTSDTTVRAARADGAYAPSNLSAIYAVGSLVVVHETAEGANGMTELRAADVVYTPPTPPPAQESQ